MFCGPDCKQTARKRSQGVSAERHLNVVSHRLRDHQEAVLAHCMGCEPDGLCRTATCRLRPVSPLPLAADVSA